MFTTYLDDYRLLLVTPPLILNFQVFQIPWDYAFYLLFCVYIKKKLFNMVWVILKGKNSYYTGFSYFMGRTFYFEQPLFFYPFLNNNCASNGSIGLFLVLDRCLTACCRNVCRTVIKQNKKTCMVLATPLFLTYTQHFKLSWLYYFWASMYIVCTLLHLHCHLIFSPVFVDWPPM